MIRSRALRISRWAALCFLTVSMVFGLGAMAPAAAGVGFEFQFEKFVNGLMADTAPGPTVVLGSNVTFTYVLSQTITPVSNVVVQDNNGTVATLADDFEPALSSGDNGNGILDLGETWTFIAVRPVTTLGQYENFAVARGLGTNPSGTTFVIRIPDTGHYFAVAAVVPEPSSIVVLGIGLAGLALRLRRRRTDG